MADSISTLALRVDSQTALAHLNEFGLAAANLGSKTDILKGKLLQLNARFLGLNFAKTLVNQAAAGQEATGKFDAVVGRFGERAKKVTQDLARDFNYSGAAAKRAVAGMVDTFTGAGLSIEDSARYGGNVEQTRCRYRSVYQRNWGSRTRRRPANFRNSRK